MYGKSNASSLHAHVGIAYRGSLLKNKVEVDGFGQNLRYYELVGNENGWKSFVRFYLEDQGKLWQSERSK